MVPGTTEMAPAALYGLPPEATKELPHERDQLTSDCQLPPVTVMPLVMAGDNGGGGGVGGDGGGGGGDGGSGGVVGGAGSRP